MNLKTFDTSIISKAINTHHQIYDFPIKDLAAENIFANFAKSTGKEVKWNVGGHAPGSDLFIKDELRLLGYSIKSAKEPQNGKWLSISSYRTTSKKTLEEKRNYIRENEKIIAGYAIFSRVEYQRKPLKYLTYTVYLIDPELLNIDYFDIKQVEQNYHGENKFGVKIDIVENMSAQVWYKVPMNLVKDSDLVTKLCSVGPIEVKMW